MSANSYFLILGNRQKNVKASLTTNQIRLYLPIGLVWAEKNKGAWTNMPQKGKHRKAKRNPRIGSYGSVTYFAPFRPSNKRATQRRSKKNLSCYAGAMEMHIQFSDPNIDPSSWHKALSNLTKRHGSLQRLKRTSAVLTFFTVHPIENPNAFAKARCEEINQVLGLVHANARNAQRKPL